jgi:hypothetical protein
MYISSFFMTLLTHAGSGHVRKKFRQGSGSTAASAATGESAATEPPPDTEEVKQELKTGGGSLSPCPEFSPDTEHIAKKKRAMFQVTKPYLPNHAVCHHIIYKPFITVVLFYYDIPLIKYVSYRLRENGNKCF